VELERLSRQLRERTPCRRYSGFILPTCPSGPLHLPQSCRYLSSYRVRPVSSSVKESRHPCCPGRHVLGDEGGHGMGHARAPRRGDQREPTGMTTSMATLTRTMTRGTVPRTLALELNWNGKLGVSRDVRCRCSCPTSQSRRVYRNGAALTHDTRTRLRFRLRFRFRLRLRLRLKLKLIVRHTHDG
jgi:hypothetical protein